MFKLFVYCFSYAEVNKSNKRCPSTIANNITIACSALNFSKQLAQDSK
ncbi:MAG: hypothetical protein LBJ00_14110 [Planctomycetaceae bacterium]|nr:hypothetical protein [Planctomycetaceae bacterium]